MLTQFTKTTKLTVLIAIIAVLIFFNLGSTRPTFKSVKLARGDLVVSISATGTVEPEEVIDVGAQVAGMVSSFGKDINGRTIDYGSEVEEGTPLAKIDESLYQSDVDVSDAQLKRANANSLQYVAKFQQAEADWKRAQKLGPSDALSLTAFDNYRAAYETAKAQLAVGVAEIAQAEAALARARRNLGYCTITSPVKGVIIDRRVNIGQTVVASLNAPSLFLIARDLKRMQVWVSVNEADIGQIQVDQKVEFSVDAFPNEKFEGRVGKIRLNASMSQNVVTYVVEVNADNPNGRLLPYLTADVRFLVRKSESVFLVPNSALRWTPRKELISEMGGIQGDVLWIPYKEGVRPLAVKVGDTSGGFTEVSGSGLVEGMEIVLGEVASSSQSNPGSINNPFTPVIPRGGNRR